MGKELMFKVESNGNYCVVHLLSDALSLIEQEFDNFDKESDEVIEMTITTIEMSCDEIEELGEFEGFC